MIIGKIFSARQMCLEGTLIPKWYGIAYWDLNSAVCYPVPFHLIVKMSMHVYWKFKYGFRPTLLDKAFRYTYEAGYNKGYEAGKNKQAMEIVEKALAQTSAAFKKEIELGLIDRIELLLEKKKVR